MGFQLEDGLGTGKVASVDDENRLAIRGPVQEFDEHINQESGKVWSIPFEGLNPAGADDYVVYIKNDGDKVLHISDVRIMADTAATQVEIHAVTGTASGGTDVSAVSRTVEAAATPTATIQTGTDITGLTTAGTLFFIQCAVVNTEYHLVSSSKIRIPKGKAIALLIETATANVTGTISLVEEE
jgi:hypothetical protein